jgi:hypothetical protein
LFGALVAAAATAVVPLPPSPEVAYSYGGAIELMRPDGSGAVRLATGRPVCSPRSGLNAFDRLDYAPPGRAFVRRGVLYVDVATGRASEIAGGASVTIYAEAGPGRSLPGLLGAGAALRPFTRSARPLRAPGLPATLLRRLRRTERALRRSGTIEDAARAVGIDRRLVGRRLRLARAVDALPRVRALGCERR